MKNIKYVLAIVFMLVGIVGLKAFAEGIVLNGETSPNDDSSGAYSLPSFQISPRTIDTIDVSAMPVLKSIVIVNPATKLSYMVGDALDISGLKVLGNYNDDTTKLETITKSNITGFDSSRSASNQVLTITVSGKTATFTVNVESITSEAPMLESITIENPATKLSYTAGEDLDLLGLKVVGLYNDGTTQVVPITIANISGFNKAFVGQQILTITIGKSTTTFTVNVVSAPVSHGGGGGGYIRPVVLPLTIAPNNGVGQVLGAEKFNFTLLLKKGLRGNEVIELQKFLNTVGYNCGTADGIFGSKTKAAVIKFQTAKGLQVDGIVGKYTREALNK